MTSDRYQVGGSLSIDAPCYVEREADRELYTAIRAGEFCYALNPEYKRLTIALFGSIAALCQRTASKTR